MEAESAIKVAEMEGLAGTWDGEAKIITKSVFKRMRNRNENDVRVSFVQVILILLSFVTDTQPIYCNWTTVVRYRRAVGSATSAI